MKREAIPVGVVIKPSCVGGGYTGETNSLNTYQTGPKTCTVLSNNDMTFVENK